MPLEVQLCSGLLIALVVAHLATPVAVRVANRLQFFDKPAGYKGHAAPTPYLGGAAVMVAFTATVAVLAGEPDRTLPVIAGALLLWGVGTTDDRVNLSPYLRLVVEFGIAAGLWALGLGWDLGLGGAVDLVVTCLWIAGVINAFNLFDNMDGAASTIASVVAAAVAVLGAIVDDAWLAVAAAALCGACVGFLPHNLASPARIFLGDGGSMPVGFCVAALVMIGTSDAATEWQALAIGVLLVGVPLLDTCLVVISRRRRGISILTGGRDHLTHRTRSKLETARAVALALGTTQALLAALALATFQGGSSVIVVAVGLYVLAAGTAIVLLDTDYVDVHTGADAPGTGPMRPKRRLPPAAIVVAPIGLALGLSPFVYGGYDSDVWAPAGVVLIVLVIAAGIARPARLSRPAALVLGCVVATGALALLSQSWAPSDEMARLFANRTFTLAALLALLLLLVRDRTASVWALGSAVAGVLVVAGWTVVRMLGADGPELFAGGRLHEPLGYINGQATMYLLAFLAALALAGTRRSIALAGAGAAAATLFGGLAVLSQSRGVVIAAAAGVLVTVLLVDGRLRRGWALVVVAGGVALALPALLGPFEDANYLGVPADSAASAGRMLLVGAAAAGLSWAGVTWAAPRIGGGGREAIRRGTLALVAVAAGALAVFASVRAGAIEDTIRDQYDAFTAVEVRPDASGRSRLLSGAGTRYDYWRIAYDVFEDHPVAGIGAGGYAVPYFEQRRSTEDVRQPHSVVMQTLAELGLVGFLLLVGIVVGIGWALVAGARRARAAVAERAVVAAAGGMVVAWLVQSSVDWIQLIPGITGVAFVALAVLLRRDPGSGERSPGRAPSRQLAIAGAVVGAVLVLAVLLSLSRQALSEHYRERAQSVLADDPSEALELANRSLRLNADAPSTYYVKAAALARFGEANAARAALEEALRREPTNFVTWALLGDLETRAGDDAAARRAYAEAVRLNPLDETLNKALAGAS